MFKKNPNKSRALNRYNKAGQKYIKFLHDLSTGTVSNDIVYAAIYPPCFSGKLIWVMYPDLYSKDSQYKNWIVHRSVLRLDVVKFMLQGWARKVGRTFIIEV